MSNQEQTRPDLMPWGSDEDVEVGAVAELPGHFSGDCEHWRALPDFVREAHRQRVRRGVVALSPRVAALVAEAERAGAVKAWDEGVNAAEDCIAESGKFDWSAYLDLRNPYLATPAPADAEDGGDAWDGCICGDTYGPEECPVHCEDDGEAVGCDCTELCEMGPTCPGGSLAQLPGSGCWRTRLDAEDGGR